MFLLCVSCVAVPISRENSSIFLGLGKHGPALVILTSQYCPHCQDIMPVWRQLEEKYEGSASILIGTVTCNLDERLCNSFPNSYTPSVFLVRTTPDQAEQYTGAIELSELSSYVEKAIAPSIVNISSEVMLKSELEKHNESSVFIFQNLNDKVFAKVRSVAGDFEAFPCHFFNLQYRKWEMEEPVFVNYYFPTNRSVQFDKAYSKKNLRSFVERLAYPPVSPMSQAFFDHAKEMKSLVLVLADERPYYQSKLLRVTPLLDPFLRACVIHCANTPRMCLRLIIPVGNGPRLLMYNPERKLIWYYKGDLGSARDVAEWTREVAAGKIRATGPGAGLAGFIGNFVDDALHGGYAGLTMIVSFICVFIVIISAGLVHSLRRQNMFGYQKLD